MMQGMGMGMGMPQGNFGSAWGQGAPMWGGSRMPQDQGSGGVWSGSNGYAQAGPFSGAGMYRGGWGRQQMPQDGEMMGAATPYGQPAPRPPQPAPTDGGQSGTQTAGQMSPFQNGGMMPPWMMGGGMMGPQQPQPQPATAPTPAPYSQKPAEMFSDPVAAPQQAAKKINQGYSFNDAQAGIRRPGAPRVLIGRQA